MSSNTAGRRLEGLYTRARGVAGPFERRNADMSRLSTIFRRRGGDSGSGQETQGQNAPASGNGPAPDSPGFRDRGKLRRRLRYLRRVRDLQLRDLGGLVYETYRQKRPSQELVDRKVSVLAATDSELSGLEVALDDRRPLRELRVPGIGGECPRCGELYGSAARFCSNCGAGLAGLAGQAAAPQGQVGGAPASPRPAASAAPAAAAAAPAGSVLANWSSVGALPDVTPDKGASKRATPGAEAKPATPGAKAKTPGAEAKPATPGAEAKPGSAATPSPAKAAETQPATPAPGTAAAKAGDAPSALSGGQGIGSGDPLAQKAPAASPPPGPRRIGSGDPLGQGPSSAPASPRAPMSSGDPLAPRPSAEDETVVMRGSDDKPAAGDDASRNGGDESHAKARTARSPDESE
jgi:hypothetical protein